MADIFDEIRSKRDRQVGSPTASVMANGHEPLTVEQQVAASDRDEFAALADRYGREGYKLGDPYTTADLLRDTAEKQEAVRREQVRAVPDLVAGAKDVGKLLYDVPVQTVGAVGQLMEGKYPGEEVGVPDWLRSMAKERTEKRAAELTPEQRETPVLPRLPFMDKPITRGDIYDTSASTGFSAVSMGAGALGGLAGGAVGAAEGGVPAVVTAPAGALAASGAAAYRMDRVAATEQLLDHFAKAKGRPLTIDEQRTLIDAHDSDLFRHAMWEAGPEALSNVFGVLPGMKNIAKGMSKKAFGRLFSGMARLYGTELATETVTQLGQQRAESRMGIRDEPERDWSSQEDWDKSFQEVAPQVLLLSSLMGGGAASAGKARQVISGRQGQQETVTPSMPEERKAAVAAMNQAVSTIRRENLPTKELRAMRDDPALLEDRGVDAAAVDTLLVERADDVARAKAVLDSIPDPGALTRAGKTGLRQRWAESVLDLQRARNRTAQEAGLAVDAAETLVRDTQPDMQVSDDTQVLPATVQPEAQAVDETDYNSVADGAAQLLTGADIANEQDRTVRIEQAETFLADQRIPESARKRFINSGALEFLGLNREDYLDEQGAVAVEQPAEPEGAVDLAPPATMEELREQVGEERFQQLLAETRSRAGGKQTQRREGAQKELEAGQTQAEAEEAGTERVESVGPARRLEQQDTVTTVEPTVEAAPAATQVQPAPVVPEAAVAAAAAVLPPALELPLQQVAVAKNIRAGRTERLVLTRPESISAAQVNKNYNTVPNDDGTVTIKGVNIDGKWVGEAPATAPPVQGQSTTVTNQESVVAGQEAVLEPTEAQKKAGNYRKPHVRLDGMDISIENPAGSIRSGTDRDGKAWSVTMENDYGYIKGSRGYDKDHVDVFFSNGYQGGADTIYIVDQYNDDGTFDEHKVVIGPKSKREALTTYKRNFERGWTGGRDVVAMPMEQFRQWVKSGEPKKGPAAAQQTVAESAAIRKQKVSAGKSLAGAKLPADQQADVRSEIEKVFGKTVRRQEKAGVIEIVTPERAENVVRRFKGSIMKSVKRPDYITEEMAINSVVANRILKELSVGGYHFNDNAYEELELLADGSLDEFYYLDETLRERGARYSEVEDYIAEVADEFSESDSDPGVFYENFKGLQGEPVPSEYIDRAISRFGLTVNPNLAGYMLPDGRMLDFSEGQGERIIDHRQVESIIRLPEIEGRRYGAIEEFGFETGAVRMDVDRETMALDFLVPPTDAQIETLLDAIGPRDIVVDYIDKNGRQQSTEGDSQEARKILNYVKNEAGKVEVKYSQGDGIIEGLTLPDGKVWLVQGNIEAGKASGVLAHELGVHARKLGFLDEKSFQSILDRVGRLAEQGTDDAVNAARARVPEDTAQGNINEEILAYLVSSAPQHGLVRRLIAAVKRFLAERGWFRHSLDKLSVADLQALAQSAVRREAAAVQEQKTEVEKPVAEQRKEGIKYSRAEATKDQQAILHTENLNASRDGEKSKASVSHGEQIIESIIKKLAAVSSPAVAEKYGKDRIDKSIKQYEAALKASRDPLKNAAEKQKFAASFVQQLPAATRARLLQRLSQVARVRSPKAQQKRLDGFLEHAETVLTMSLRRDIRDSMEKQVKALKRNRPGKAREGRGYELERDLEYLRDTVFNLSSEEAVVAEEAAQQARYERLQTRLRDLQERFSSARTQEEAGRVAEKIEQVQDEIDEVQSRSNLLTTFGLLNEKDLYDLVSAKKVLLQLIEDGRLEWREHQEFWRTRNAENRAKLSQEITGQENPKPETQAQRIRRQEQEGVFAKVKEGISTIMNTIQSWELAMDTITEKSGKKSMQSWAVDHYGSLAHDGTRSYEREQMETYDRLQEKAYKVFNIDKGKRFSAWKLARKFSDLNKKQDGKVSLYYEGGGSETISLSPLEAAYWYQISKDDSKATRRTLKGMGVTEETLEQIEGLMGPEVKAWADWLVDEFYQDFHTGINKVHRQMYGIDLKKTKNYVPFMREVRGKTEDKQIQGILGLGNTSVKKGGFIERVQTTRPFKVMNLNDVLFSHVDDMNHFKAWALPSKEINGTFNSPEIRGYIEQYYGRAVAKEIEKFQKHFAMTPNELNAGTNRAVDNIRANVIRASIGANPVVFFKQLTSIPAYAADIPVDQWVKYTAAAMANPMRAAKVLGRSTMMQARYRNGFERDVAHAMRRKSGAALAGQRRIGDMMMAMTQLGDKAAITIGGYAVYKYHLEQNLKKARETAKAEGRNVTDAEREQADKAALDQFEKSTERAQQSSHTKDIGSFQRGGSWQRLFTMYLTSPASYSRQLYSGVRNFKRDPARSSKILFIYGVVLPAMFQAVADALLLGGDDDDDPNRFMKNQAKAIVLGPFNGLPIIRTMAQGYGNILTGQYFFDDQFSPVAGVFDTSKKVLDYTVRYAIGGTDRVDSEEYARRAIIEAIHTVGYATGMPTKPVGRIGSGIQDFFGFDLPIREAEETEHPVRRMLGYSKYALGEK